MRLPVLSFWEPWASLVASGAKPIENRRWVPSPKTLPLGGRFAIHASKRKPSVDDFRNLADEMSVRGIAMPELGALRFGEIIATARLDHFVLDASDIAPEHRFWFMGPVGWVLDEVRPLRRGVPAKGQQGFFWLAPEVEAQVLDLETSGVQESARG